MADAPPPGRKAAKDVRSNQNGWWRMPRNKIPQALVFIMILGSLLHEHVEDLSSINAQNERFGAAVSQYLTWNFSDEIYSRVMSCNYEYLVVCVPSYRPCLSMIELPNTNPVCLKYQDADYSKGGDWISMIVHLPDALVYLLVQRWQRGGLEFSLALLFVLGVVTAVVTAARSSLLYIPGAVVGAPILISILFWITQHLLSVLSLGVGYLLALGMSAATIMGTLHYLSLGHDLHSLSEAGQRMFKSEEETQKESKSEKRQD